MGFRLEFPFRQKKCEWNGNCKSSDGTWYGPGAEVQGGQDEGRHGWWQVPQEEVGQGQGAGQGMRHQIGDSGNQMENSVFFLMFFFWIWRCETKRNCIWNVSTCSRTRFHMFSWDSKNPILAYFLNEFMQNHTNNPFTSYPPKMIWPFLHVLS